MRLPLFVTLFVTVLGCASSGISTDEDTNARALNSMDRTVPEELVQARLDLVESLGISGLADDADPPAPGDLAPDFSLRPIRFYDFQFEDEITTQNAGSLFEPVSLSSFRGQPVVLIFGSYT